MNLGLFIGFFIMILTESTHILCFNFCNDSKLSVNKEKGLMLIIVSLLNAFNNYFNVNIFKILISFILLVLLCVFWFKQDLKKTIIICLIISIVSMFLEFILCCIIALIVKNVDQLNKMLFLKNSITVILIVSLYFIFANKSINKTLRKIIKYLESKINIEYILVISIMLLNLILIKFNVDYRSSMNYFFNIIILFLLSILIINLFKTIYENKIYKIKSNDMQETIQKYEKIIDDYQELKHNLNNDLIAIKSVSSKKAQKIIDEKMKKYNKNYSWINNYAKMPKGLQGLIYLKLKDIKNSKLNIEVNSNVKAPMLNQLNSKQYSQLCDIIGILLDNAIYSAKESKDKIIYISLNKRKNILNIEIMNSFINNIDLEKIGKKNYTTKSKGGIGLNYIAKNKLKTISLKKEIINNFFKVSVQIKLKDTSKK